MRQLWLFLVGLALSLAVAASAVAMPKGLESSTFCNRGVIRDYEGSLVRSLPSRPLPHELPFGPPGLEANVLRDGGGQLRYLGSSPSYQFVNSLRDTAMDLNWKVDIELSPVDSSGVVAEPVSKMEADIGTVSPESVARIGGGAFSDLGVFRIGITFIDETGNQLGSYDEFVQVVRARFQVKLGLSRYAIRPGGILKARLENLGTREITYGDPYILERRQEGRWQKVPPRHPFFAPLHGAGAGTAGRCDTIHIPRTGPPGLYRLRKMFHPGSQVKTDRFATETFRVLG